MPGVFDPFALADAAIAHGLLKVTPDGDVVVAKPGETLQKLEAARDARKTEQSTADDDSADQERIILGWALRGEQDNAQQWARFRTTLGLTPGQEIPADLWTDNNRLRIAQEIDLSFRGHRDMRVINGRALIESYRLRTERGQVSDSLQLLAQLIAELSEEVSVLVANDFLMAIEILQSKRARANLKVLMLQCEKALRADRPVEQVVSLVTTGIDRTRALVAGRLGQDYSFDDPSSIAEDLRPLMLAEQHAPIPTGIYALDIDLRGGVQPGRGGKLNILAARTGVGKTTVGIAAACGLMRNGADVLFLSCELNSQEVGARVFANQGYANGYRIADWVLEGRARDRGLHPEFLEASQRWRDQIEAGEIGRFQSKALFHASADEFCEFMYAAKAKNPRLSAVFMDHFHAMKPSPGYGNRSQEMEARSLQLHQAAKAAGVDLFLLAQLNREACLSAKPQLEHINGTDALAQLATAVWLLEFPKRDPGEQFNPSMLNLHHGKYRNGQYHGDRRVVEEESGLLIVREFCQVTDRAL